MTTNFYAPPSAYRAGRVVLPEEEARHARTVLRAQEGDEIAVVDGDGGWHHVRLTQVSGQQVVGTVLERKDGVGEPSVDVTVGVGILKKRSRLETFVEKAVELGVKRIVPLRTKRTERDSVRHDRLERVMVSAMKQCRRSWLPRLAEPASPSALLGEVKTVTRLVCYSCDRAVPVRQAAAEAIVDPSVLLLVGPEGGFAPSEVEMATDQGCTLVSLGARRLRAETAGLVAVHSMVAAAGSGSAEGES